MNPVGWGIDEWTLAAAVFGVLISMLGFGYQVYGRFPRLLLSNTTPRLLRRVRHHGVLRFNPETGESGLVDPKIFTLAFVKVQAFNLSDRPIRLEYFACQIDSRYKVQLASPSSFDDDSWKDLDSPWFAKLSQEFDRDIADSWRVGLPRIVPPRESVIMPIVARLDPRLESDRLILHFEFRDNLGHCFWHHVLAKSTRKERDSDSVTDHS